MAERCLPFLQLGTGTLQNPNNNTLGSLRQKAGARTTRTLAVRAPEFKDRQNIYAKWVDRRRREYPIRGTDFARYCKHTEVCTCT